jgi:truncated hemoglobin YjbI
MPLTSEQVKAIQDSFAKVVPISEQAAEIFYGRLFEIAPAMKLLFRGDMKEQGKKLMAMLTVVINGLSNLEAVAGGKRARQTPRRIRRQGDRLCAGRRGVVVDA